MIGIDVMVLLEGRVAVVLGSGESERELVIHRPRDLMIELNLLTGQRVHASGVVERLAKYFLSQRKVPGASWP